MDSILNKYISNNLNYWKNINKNKENMFNIIKKYRLPIVHLKIKNKKVTIIKKFNTKGNKKLDKAIYFLLDIANLYPQLNIDLFLNIRDTLYDEKVNAYNVNNLLQIKDNPDDYLWGVSKSDKNYIRIVESEMIDEFNFSFPIFCFERHRKMNGILFPTFGADNNNFTDSQNIDKFSWEKKDIDKSIYRGKNICCDKSNLDKIKLVNFSSLYSNDTDFKFCSTKKHPLWGKYMVSISHLKFFKNLGIINKDKKINKFRENFSMDNFVSFDYIFRHKYIVTVGSAKNRKWYLSNSCILEYKFKNKEYFHEDIFNDMEDIVYFDENNYFDKILQLKKNNYKLAKKMVKNRKKKFNNYLHYPNLVKWYGKFLLEYQKLIKI